MIERNRRDFQGYGYKGMFDGEMGAGTIRSPYRGEACGRSFPIALKMTGMV